MRKRVDIVPLSIVSAIAALAVLCATVSCSHTKSDYSSFYSFDQSQWVKGSPLYFEPDGLDSTAVYDLSLAVRYNTDYAYCDLAVAVDVIDTLMNLQHHEVKLELADEYGNWKGAGFGEFYQCNTMVAKKLPAWKMRRIALWQSLGVDTLEGVCDVGVIVTRSR
ncbi:MAG: gliding motility lipoprotein GldH [Muribaculaceae bacterium]|nr:gliding motility lipoprotein GldH [Muribaculaceae bacterium]